VLVYAMVLIRCRESKYPPQWSVFEINCFAGENSCFGTTLNVPEVGGELGRFDLHAFRDGRMVVNSPAQTVIGLGTAILVTVDANSKTIRYSSDDGCLGEAPVIVQEAHGLDPGD